MKNSKIQWTDHTINFWWGCTKVSEACTHCYAEIIDARFGKHRDKGHTHWGKSTPRLPQLQSAQEQARTLNNSAKKHGKKTRIFINSMSDWLDPEVPPHYLTAILDTIHHSPHLTFQLLTKRPHLFRERLHACIQDIDPTTNRHSPGQALATSWLSGNHPTNVWIGTTAENQTRLNQRIEPLLNIPATTRFLSCEPLLGPIDLTQCSPHILNGDNSNPGYINSLNGTCYHPRTCISDWEEPIKEQGIHLVITGGESGPQARPTHPDWLRTLRNQCQKANVHFFFKQWGEWADNCLCTPSFKSGKVCPATPRPEPGLPGHMFHCGTKHSLNHIDNKRHLSLPI